ncbi:hypothetical protein ACNUDN_05054 [Mycobacterium sp. smrl_JER01]
MQLNAAPRHATPRHAALQALTSLARRAQAAGALSQRLHIDDLVLVLLAGRALGSRPQVRREAATRRFAALASDSFRA